MVATQAGRCSRQIGLAEQKIYDHLLYWVELESPEQLIERFQSLFINGTRYSDSEIAAALDAVITSKAAQEEFRYVLNRCCHILINRWQARSQSQMAIPQLVALFESLPTGSSSSVYRSRSLRRLHELIKIFTETEQYLKLCRLAQVLSQDAQLLQSQTDQPLGTLIHRYPYLYEHCLLSEDSTREQQLTVRQIQANVQHQFEVDLSQYITFRIRASKLAAQTSPEQVSRIIKPVANPTLLEDQELGRAIKHYVGKVDGVRTHRDIACNFLTSSSQAASYGQFKDDLYQYITSAVDPEYGRRQFNRQLYNQMQLILPESDSRPLNDFLMVRTCSQLINFMVVDSPNNPDHFRFIDLLNNLGPIITTGLLLKIVLLCRKVKPALERRFSILFSHYESHTREAVYWLVNALEHLNIALSTNFGSVDLSFIR